MIGRILVRMFFGILFCFMFSGLRSQNQLLIKADSLFDQKKYTEALAIYQELYQSDFTSSAILLKMSFIQNASGDYPDALYYMNKYYLKSADRAVISKIEEVAQANNLNGYNYNDISHCTALLNKYRVWIILLLVLLMILLTVGILKKKQKKQKPVGLFIIQIMVAVVFFLIVNPKATVRGIIVSDQTLLKSGPSAGAEPLEIIDKGHRVKVLGKDKIWSRILWDGEEVYVRNRRLKTI